MVNKDKLKEFEKLKVDVDAAMKLKCANVVLTNISHCAVKTVLKDGTLLTNKDFNSKEEYEFYLKLVQSYAHDKLMGWDEFITPIYIND